MKLLITGAYRYTQEQTDKLAELGLDIDYIPYETDEIIAPEQYEAVVCNSLFLDHDIFPIQ